jgi:hypothetical protein
VQGLVRPRPERSRIETAIPTRPNSYRGDQVNTLVLVNNSKKPLLLLAGEIVTGGKQDRVIAKDRIVPVGADPIDLSVFCIEPGRWTESSPTFGAAVESPFSRLHGSAHSARARHGGEGPAAGVGFGARSHLDNGNGGSASRINAGGGRVYGASSAGASFGTTSYAKVMESNAVSEKVDEAAAPVMKARDQVLAQLRQEHAVGVVVAVRGEIVWADLFADTELLSRYWTKLVRSYAAESLAAGEFPRRSLRRRRAALSRCALGRQLKPVKASVGVYRYRELKSGSTETFVLESLLPGTGYDVHISKMKLVTEGRRVPKPYPTFSPQIYR